MSDFDDAFVVHPVQLLQDYDGVYNRISEQLVICSRHAPSIEDNAVRLDAIADTVDAGHLGELGF